MTYRRRTYPEVLDNMLTALTRGVSAEPHPFPPDERDPYRHRLLKTPVQRVISVHGSRGGQPQLFRAEKDYRLTADALVWLEGAQLPDFGSLISVNYYPETAQPVLTDIQTGSVVRTLMETTALEMARLDAQLEAVYQAGFVDTASGSALENVVALLGLERVQPGRAAGDLSFTRVPGSVGTITIPAGTRVITADGEIEYETESNVTMFAAQNSVRVSARDLEENEGLPADSLTVLPVPIAGIASVTNPQPTTIANHGETDEQLRDRAKNFLHGSERATLGALYEVLARQGIKAEIDEAPGQVGHIAVTPHAESLTPEQHQRLLTALRQVAPAGIVVDLLGAQVPRRIDLSLLLTTASGLLEVDLLAVQDRVRSQVADYLRQLPLGEDGSINRLVGMLLADPRLRDVRLLAGTAPPDPASLLDPQGGRLLLAGMPTALGELALADPNLPSRLIVSLSHAPGATLPSVAAVSGALETRLAPFNAANASEPSGLVVPQIMRTPGFLDLLAAVPLPGVDMAAATAASIAPWQLSFTLVQPGGLTRLLDADDDAYSMTPYERIVVGDVVFREVP